MMSYPHQYDEMAELLTAMSDTGLSAPQARRLGELMRGDPDIQQLYLDFVELHTMLVWQHKDDKEERGTRNEERQGGNDEGGMLNDEQPESTSGEWRVESGEPAIQCPPFGLQQPLPSPVNTIHYPLSTIHLYVGSAVFSYLAAAMIVGIGLLIAWAWKISTPEQIAIQPPAAPRQAIIESEPPMQFVGRITGMVDCQWSDATTAVPGPVAVPLGRKYALASGLLEITYDTGARVILQGPCTYEVESPAGGYLSIGKLTARVEKKEERRTKNEELSASRSSFLIPRSYFAVRTPTATVTDLGTEFGVEVFKEGLTQVHVLQGAVDAKVVNPGDGTERHQRLTEGSALEIGRKSDEFKKVAFAPQSFTRKLQIVTDTPAEAAYIKAVLADKPMAYWPLNEPAGARRFLDRSGHGIHGYAMQKVLAGQPGPLTSESRAIELNGDGYIDLGHHPEFAMKNDFTVEAWVWIGKVKRQGTVFWVYEDGVNPDGWGLGAGHRVVANMPEKPLAIFFNTYLNQRLDFSLSSGEVIEARWLHVATVCDRDNIAHLYLNGEHRGAGATAGEKPLDFGTVWLAIGGSELSASPEQVDAARWRGRLAHVAVYPRVLTAVEIQNHYRQRNEIPGTIPSVNRKETP